MRGFRPTSRNCCLRSASSFTSFIPDGAPGAQDCEHLTDSFRIPPNPHFSVCFAQVRRRTTEVKGFVECNSCCRIFVLYSRPTCNESARKSAVQTTDGRIFRLST